jgi:hypothetical protein
VLDFIDGVPSPATVSSCTHLDYVHALNVFLNGFAGASTVALRKGLAKAGADDNQVLIFSELSACRARSTASLSSAAGSRSPRP